MSDLNDDFKFGNPNKYKRHNSLAGLKGLKDKKLKRKLTLQQQIFHTASERLASSEILLPETTGFLETEGLEKSFSITQNQLGENISIGANNKRFSLDLSYGPYSISYSRNGNQLLMGGRKGHISMLDVSNGAPNILMELPLEDEQINDVQFLHDHTLFAVAQKKYIYIYDREGIEIHCIRDHVMSTYKLDFLPYHFLLCSVGEFGELKYQDISTGQISALHKTGRGPCHIMKHNPYNGVVHLGHSDGVVSLWTPNVSTPVMEIFAQKGGVTALDINNNHMITAGNDNSWKVWDIRKCSNYINLYNYKSFGSSVRSISISGTGLVSLGFGSHIQVWKDLFSKSKQKMPYITHNHPAARVSEVEFQPWNDVLCIGHTHGVETVIVPGAGYANFDSRECNIFETPKQRKNREVRMLLEKLPASTITLYPDLIGKINKTPRVVEETEEETECKNKPTKQKNKKRGRSKITNVLKNKQIAYANMVKARASKIIAQRKKQKSNANGSDSSTKTSNASGKIVTRSALERFKS
ncbi:WD40 protein (part of U3 processesome) [Cryptosporidium canis]|uniref:WD40 protein (Part of U3 processesome) n=1 Tax=Cryptosporidium canis TaxID=195482 RepID=A0ABQ8P9U5_9CRYT|nr:WD40 protein (part of U3 processesome) [Cryptosporidium canis]KAJ1614113.1 WD40 protein (part of U3 processesome) [Cryptosporidium canis]